jgi:hypothetical protein
MLMTVGDGSYEFPLILPDHSNSKSLDTKRAPLCNIVARITQF